MLYQATQYFDFNQTQGMDRIPIASFHMEGEALIWFQNVEFCGLINTWDKFAKACLMKFGLTAYVDPMESLTPLRQTHSKDEVTEGRREVRDFQENEWDNPCEIVREETRNEQSKNKDEVSSTKVESVEEEIQEQMFNSLGDLNPNDAQNQEIKNPKWRSATSNIKKSRMKIC